MQPGPSFTYKNYIKSKFFSPVEKKHFLGAQGKAVEKTRLRFIITLKADTREMYKKTGVLCRIYLGNLCQ